MTLKRSFFLLLGTACTLATAVAEVPSLINYQGRLVTADGAAQSGQKSFLLEVFDAASGGSLLYREDVGNITLGDGGVYSFQFGATGTSNTQVTETIGTGGEDVLYQQVLSNLPVVAGSVSVSDGTYTWSQSGGSSNEDDFNASFSTNLNRITVNYFSSAPNDGRSIDVIYRYQAEGITGALSSGGEHWLQLTIDGDVQATRERVLAVPFALRAGVTTRLVRKRTTKQIWFPFPTDPVNLPIPERARKLISVKAILKFEPGFNTPFQGRSVHIDTLRWNENLERTDLINLKQVEVELDTAQTDFQEHVLPLHFELEEGVYYNLRMDNLLPADDRPLARSASMRGPLLLEYEY